MKKPSLASLIALALLASTPAAHAQFAVIDIASVTQLLAEVQTLAQQLQTARSQLSQSQAEFQSITGNRGMEQLLAGTPRNYLPANWAALQSAAQPGGAAGALGTEVGAALQAESLLTQAQLASFSPAAVSQVQAQRQSAALLQGLTRQALANASGRFASLQLLINAIGQAGDQKAALDLQARIVAEHGMLQNESTKLQALYQGVQADEQANMQRTRELVVAGHGQFAARFQPQP
jgi:type IV secretion system protein VirB5